MVWPMKFSKYRWCHTKSRCKVQKQSEKRWYDYNTCYSRTRADRINRWTKPNGRFKEYENLLYLIVCA